MNKKSHLNHRILGIALAAAIVAAPTPAVAQITLNDGKPYDESCQRHEHPDFFDFTNTFFFADDLRTFDAAKGSGSLVWKRFQSLSASGIQYKIPSWRSLSECWISPVLPPRQ